MTTRSPVVYSAKLMCRFIHNERTHLRLANCPHAHSKMAEETANKKSHRDEETQGLEKVSDYVEELDAAPELGHAMSMLEGDHSKKNEAKLKRDQELAKVVIKKQEVELIMTELDVSKATAERTLREHKGDIIKALHALTD
ncbi:huntingtin-interacting protein K-like [Halichondria panicea]|uniref:huntingtin-interacting protein K-like n=1 Tax=Halichondria panicea TaxID=6063 RepID=UPI00312B7688